MDAVADQLTETGGIGPRAKDETMITIYPDNPFAGTLADDLALDDGWQEVTLWTDGMATCLTSRGAAQNVSPYDGGAYYREISLHGVSKESN